MKEIAVIRSMREDKFRIELKGITLEVDAVNLQLMKEHYDVVVTFDVHPETFSYYKEVDYMGRTMLNAMEEAM